LECSCAQIGADVLLFRHESEKQKAANKIDGIVALAMASLEAVRGASEMPLVIMAV
jgi:hypothetical protein